MTARLKGAVLLINALTAGTLWPLIWTLRASRGGTGQGMVGERITSITSNGAFTSNSASMADEARAANRRAAARVSGVRASAALSERCARAARRSTSSEP